MSKKIKILILIFNIFFIAQVGLSQMNSILREKKSKF